MKRKIYTSLLIVLMLSACATAQYGSFVDSQDVETAIAIDAVDKLQAEFPPANTAFSLGENAKNSFHAQFEQRLRAYGFGTAEQKNPNAHTLNYVLDQIYEDTYRITLYVNKTPYSRAYKKTNNGKIIPIGTWAKGE